MQSDRHPGSSHIPPPTSRVIVGLMSGTSLDGISSAVVRFTTDGSFDLLAFRQLPYDAARRHRLAAALAGTTPDEYCRLNFELGHWLADAAVAVIADAGVPRDEIAAIIATVWGELWLHRETERRDRALVSNENAFQSGA